MIKFRYTASDQSGKKFFGKVEAANVSNATHLLNSRGLVVVNLQVETGGIFGLIGSLRRGVGLGELSAFTRQLATMITSGVTITESLAILRDQVSGGLTPVVEQILADVEAGSSLANSLERHPKVFSPVYVSLVRSGETGGILDEVLIRLADNLEKEQEFRGKVIGALIYPVIVVAGMIVVMTIMMLFVIPRLSQIYQDFQAQLPTATRILIGVSSAFVRFWWLVFGFVALGVWGYSLFRKTAYGRRKIDELILRIPIFGPLRRQIMLTEFTRTLGLLVSAGVLILESLQAVSKVSGSEVLTEAVVSASRDVEKGFPLAWALGQQEEVFTPMVARMIAVGEETGKLDEVLGKISHILEVESEMKVRALTSALEPLIMVLLGIGVGFLVIAIILPIYNLTSQL